MSSDRPIQVINAVSSASGHVNNLSTTAAEDSGGFRDGGGWSVMDGADDGEGGNGPVANTYGVGDVVPGGGAIDRFPTFRYSTPPGDRTYQRATARDVRKYSALTRASTEH